MMFNGGRYHKNIVSRATFDIAQKITLENMLTWIFPFIIPLNLWKIYEFRQTFHRVLTIHDKKIKKKKIQILILMY